MKMNVSKIVLSHIQTLRDQGSGKIFIKDIFVFYIVPFFFAYLLMSFDSLIGRDFYLALFTFLGIFIAVSSNIQGNLVSVFHSERARSEDPRIDARISEQHGVNRLITRELSNTLSYLNLFTLFSMVILLCAISDSPNLFLFKWVSVVIVFHFLFTFLMVLKRSHALFQFEFS